MREYPHLNVNVVQEHAIFIMPHSLIGPREPYHSAHSGSYLVRQFLFFSSEKTTLYIIKPYQKGIRITSSKETLKQVLMPQHRKIQSIIFQ